MAEQIPPAGDDSKALEAKLTALEQSVAALEGNNKNLVEEKRKVEQELKVLKDKDKNAAELLPEKENKIAELEKTLTEITEAKTAEETKRKDLEASIRKTYLEQLPEEHRAIASLIPTIDGLVGYTKLNAVKAPPSDSGKTGTGNVDTTGKKWNDLNEVELAELRKSNFREYAKLYKEEYGIVPTENF